MAEGLYRIGGKYGNGRRNNNYNLSIASLAVDCPHIAPLYYTQLEFKQ